MREWVIGLLYVVAGGCFVLSLKWLTHPATARRAVRVGEVGMLLAVIGTLLQQEIVDLRWIAVAVVIGSTIGAVIAVFVPMTAMPQRIALSHAFGALAAALVGIAELHLGEGDLSRFTTTVLGAEILLGSLTFTGSMMAFGKLQGLVRDRPLLYRGQNLVNGILLAVGLVMVVMLAIDPSKTGLLPWLIAIGLAFGVMMVIRIGGADMPVVISLLNSFAGLSGAALGFAIANPILIIAGALDGSSGFLLSIFMCRAMNRSFTNVIFGGFGAEEAGGGAEQRPIRVTSVEETAMLLDSASFVVIVPGYGMAAAQAQHKVAEVANDLIGRGVEVRFAIHPVAGRMPGHMNVLLAEANVPYDLLVDIDEINPEFERADVVLVIGANDTVNPAARHDQGSPIFGMPILDVDKARSVIVIKRSLRSGFAGIENELFYLPQTMMLFGDAREVAGGLAHELSAQRSSR
jgi:NAD(P) transhydrogenase subunit beta